MHRRHASPIFLLGVVVAACGGRIAQGDNVGSQNDSPTTTSPIPTTSSTSSPPPAPTSTATLSAACGPETCGANAECCVGGYPGYGSAEGSLESCVPSGTCDTGIATYCGYPAREYPGDGCDPSEICCITVNPTTERVTSGCALSCGDDGTPAIQVCSSDADCPSGSTCITAAIGPNGEGETMQICGGVR